MNDYKCRKIYTFEIWTDRNGVTKAMVGYVKTNHTNLANIGHVKGCIGIILCNSKKEAEARVAEFYQEREGK